MSKTIRLARLIIAERFKKDASLKNAYIDSVAIILYERLGIHVKQERYDVAIEIVDLIFNCSKKDYNYTEEIANDMRGVELNI